MIYVLCLYVGHVIYVRLRPNFNVSVDERRFLAYQLLHGHVVGNTAVIFILIEL
jgi:hypothetical protein